jgi:hypothetical protein
MERGVRKSVTIPGLLAGAVGRRCKELGYSFAPYAVDLVCFDLRMASKHSVTLALASDTQAAHDAVDRELVVRYRPGQKREGLLVQLASRMQDIADRSRHDARPAPLNAVPLRVTFPFRLWEIVHLRWQELGYGCLSAYLTGLIRYDLLIGGPHRSITADCRSKVQRALTRKTLAARRKGGKRKTLLDHLIERAEGRAVTEGEMEKLKSGIAETIRNISLANANVSGPHISSS